MTTSGPTANFVIGSATSSVQEQLLSLAERSAKAGTWTWHIPTNQFFWSPGMFALFGLDPVASPAGFESWLSRLHPDDRAQAEDRAAKALEDRAYLFNQYRIIRPDGQICWIDSYGDLTFADDGSVERMSGFCVDVSRRIQLEEDKASLSTDLEQSQNLKNELRKSQERLSLALEGSRLAIWDWDIAARKVFFGGRWPELLGYSFDELGEDEKRWLGLVHPDERDRFRKGLSDCLSGNSAILECEHRLQHKDRHWIHVEFRGKVSHRDTKDVPLRMVGTVLDITSRKRLKEEGIDLLNQIAALIAEASSGKPRHADSVNPADGLSRGNDRPYP